jgi:hypothetical protein
MWISMGGPALALALGGATALAGSVVSLNPAASNALMDWVLAVMAFQAVVSIALIIAGVWGPIRRWLRLDEAKRREPATKS